MSVNKNERSGRDLLALLCALLAAAGIAFYFSWSVVHGTWTDLGVYSVSVVLIAFGIVGFILYSMEEE